MRGFWSLCSLTWPMLALAQISSIPLPVIPLSLAASPWSLSPPLRAAAKQALERYGACFIELQDVPKGFAAASLAAAQHLFTHTTLQEQEELEVGFHGGFRGFIPLLRESGSSHLKEIKEAFSYGMPQPSDPAALESDERREGNPLEAPNVWPRSLPVGLQKRLETVVTTMATASQAVVQQVLSELEGLSNLPSLTEDGDKISLMRAFHYFPKHGHQYREKQCGEQDDDDGVCTGSSPHTDWGLLTFILTNDFDSLQFWHQHKWHRATPDYTTLRASSGQGPQADKVVMLMNAGDYLSVLSHGRVRSPLHRVVLTNRQRLAFVYFAYPGFDAKLPTAEAEGARDFQLSLLADQSEADGTEERADPMAHALAKASKRLADMQMNLDFGQLILNKWKQVYRPKSQPQQQPPQPQQPQHTLSQQKNEL